MPLPTARAYAGLHTVVVTCKHCDHDAALDLAALVADGYGDIPLVELPLRCRACGLAGHAISILGSPYRW